MTYEITRRPPIVEACLGPRYLVEKVLDPGERYLIASFVNQHLADRCLATLQASIEASPGEIPPP